jgi:hypothetical protein
MFRKTDIKKIATMMKNKPFALYLLALLLLVQSLGGLFGGISLVASPSGAILQMPVSMLEGSPFSDFLVPGLILLLFLGIFPGILAVALLKRPVWKWFGMLNIYPGIHWSWTYSLYLGIMLVVWILVEIMWIDYDLLQTAYGLLGVAIIIITGLPGTMRHFGWKNL